jgi:hypothetical protein
MFLKINTGSVQAGVPKLFIPDSIQHLGEITEGQTVEYSFIIKNTGDAALEILSVTPDCGCAKVRIMKPAIAAGEQGEIRVAFNSTGQSGSFTKLIIIETNDPAEPVKMIKCKGTVLRKSEKG